MPKKPIKNISAKLESPEDIAKERTQCAALVIIYSRGQVEKIFANLDNTMLIEHYQMIQRCMPGVLEDSESDLLLMAAKTEALTVAEHMLKDRGIDPSKHTIPESLEW